MSDLSQGLHYLCDENSIAAVQSAADLPTMHAKNGMPTIMYGGMRLHSTIDPLAEAELLVKDLEQEFSHDLHDNTDVPITVVILGPGLGYVVKTLNRLAGLLNISTQMQVLCVEEDAEVARKALELRVWEPTSLSVRWMVGHDNYDRLKTMLGSGRKIAVNNTAGYRMHKDKYDRIASLLSEQSIPERPMRVLVPTPLYGGSLPIAHHCAAAFRSLGHQVELLDLAPYYDLYRAADTITGDNRHRRSLQGLLTTYLAEMVAARAMDWKADLVWAVAQVPVTPTSLQELRHEGIYTAFWFVEDYTVFGYWREIAPHFDAVFTIQRGDFLDELRQIGVSHAAYLPCAANPAVHRPMSLTAEEMRRYGSAVSFVGAGYYNRQALFAQWRLPDFKIWGNDWPNDCAVREKIQEQGRRVDANETAMIYSASKVNLNLHSSPFHSAVNPNGDYVNPRTYEIASCGGFQIVDARKDLSKAFNNDEIIAFSGVGELPQLVEHYLAHEDERREIADRARQRVLREHTYEHRIAEAMSYLQTQYPKLSDRKRGPNYISSLKAAAGGDEDLLQFLSQYNDDEEITLDQIVSRIRLGNNRLSNPEGLFLLMKEFRDWGREKGVIQ